MLRLFLHVFDEVGAVDAFGEAREILYEGGEGKLAAGFVTADYQGFQIGASGIDGCGVAGAAGADDDDVAH